MLEICEMSYGTSLSTDVWLNGLFEAQQEACYAARQAFLHRHDLSSWGLNVTLSDDGPETWRADISVVAPAEFDFQVRSSNVTIGKTVDLAQVIDLCLETHYNACMNRKAMPEFPLAGNVYSSSAKAR